MNTNNLFYEKLGKGKREIKKIKQFSEPLWIQISSFFKKMPRKFHIRILDIKYQSELEQLNLRYVTYEVVAQNEKDAIKKAQKLYMNGKKELYSEELPFLFKIFSANECV